jgi:hypothetical protein
MNGIFEERRASHDDLLNRIKDRLPALEELQQEMAEAEDIGFLHFYRSDPSVYDLRKLTAQAASLLRDIAADGELALSFEVIMQDATASKLDLTSSRMWILSATPTIAGFYHCRFFVERLVRYGHELEQSPDMLPSGWAAILCLYCLR